MTEHPGINDINAGDFEEQVIVASESLPVLVDFWADWCRPCKILAPLLEQLVHEYEGYVKVVNKGPLVKQYRGKLSSALN